MTPSSITGGTLGHVTGGSAQSQIANGAKPATTRSVSPQAGPGQVAFASSDPPINVVCKLGETAAIPSGGGGGWETFDRPGRKQGQVWRGTPLYELAIPVLLDGLGTMTSVEPDIFALESLWRPAPFSPRGTTPPIVQVAGMVPHKGLRYTLVDLQFGDAIWDGGSRVRQWLTVVIREWEPIDLVVVAAQAKSPKTKGYTVKKGDTLGQIARKQMGARTAREIQDAVQALKKANSIRDSKSLKPGQKLKIPASAVTAVKGTGTAHLP